MDGYPITNKKYVYGADFIIIIQVLQKEKSERIKQKELLAV